MRLARAAHWLSACALLWSAACASSPATKASEPPLVAPLPLLPPSAMDYDFQWRQRVSARWPTGTHSFDAVLQKRAGELTLVGLSPLGLPGFVFRLSERGQLHVENRTGKALPFEPAYVVADVQRVFFPWLPQPPPDFSGERSGRRGESVIVERYQTGRLLERRFERDTSHGRERVVVHYESSGPASSRTTLAPVRAELDNALLRYGLVIETIEQTRL